MTCTNSAFHKDDHYQSGVHADDDDNTGRKTIDEITIELNLFKLKQI